jgi:hypothetical protein
LTLQIFSGFPDSSEYDSETESETEVFGFVQTKSKCKKKKKSTLTQARTWTETIKIYSLIDQDDLKVINKPELKDSQDKHTRLFSTFAAIITFFGHDA